MNNGLGVMHACVQYDLLVTEDSHSRNAILEIKKWCKPELQPFRILIQFFLREVGTGTNET
jgi:hypothetical protein